MNKDFDLNRIGKRMPYTVPENFWMILKTMYGRL